MLERGKMERGIFEIVDTESLVPAEHLLRKIDAAVGFNKIYDSEKVFSDGRILSTAIILIVFPQYVMNPCLA